jgi:hypothetical protein
MAAHTAHENHDHDSKHGATATLDPVSATERERRVSRSPHDSLEALEKHEKEVKADEEARTKAFEDSPRGKLIKSRTEKAKKDAEGKEVKDISEDDARKRAFSSPPLTKEGEPDLPQGAVLPPASKEPYWMNAPAWAQPLSEPPPEDIGTPVAAAK